MLFNHLRASDIRLCGQSKLRASSQPGEAGKEKKKEEAGTMGCTPEINMSPCQACPCITAPLPGASRCAFELQDERAVVAPIADVLGRSMSCDFTGIQPVRRN